METSRTYEETTLPELLTSLLNSVSTLEAKVATLEQRLNYVYNYEERCMTIMETSLDYIVKNDSDEMKNEVVKTVVYLVAKHNHEVIISDEELARLIVRTYFDLKIENRKKRMRQEKEQLKLIEEISSISLEEEEIHSPVTIIGEEELASPITEQDLVEEEATSLSSDKLQYS